MEKETVVTKDSIITVEKIVEVKVEKELSKWQNTNQFWIHRYRFHIVFRLQNSPKVRVTFGLILLGIDKIYGA